MKFSLLLCFAVFFQISDFYSFANLPFFLQKFDLIFVEFIGPVGPARERFSKFSGGASALCPVSYQPLVFRSLSVPNFYSSFAGGPAGHGFAENGHNNLFRENTANGVDRKVFLSSL